MPGRRDDASSRRLGSATVRRGVGTSDVGLVVGEAGLHLRDGVTRVRLCRGVLALLLLAQEGRHSVRLLEADAELGANLPARDFDRARSAITAPVIRLFPNLWPRDARSFFLGMLVIEGALTREVLIADRACARLVGPGDMLRPSHHLGLGAPVPSRVEWRVLTPTSLAVLDHRVLCAICQFPELVAAITLRGVARSQALAVALAISHMPGIKLRLLALLWHLADRFGRVRGEAVVLPLPLTHRVLSRMLGASRPTVSTAMKELEN